MPRPVHNESSYLPGLDGVRAVAVALVLAYHLQAPGFGGGLLGVGVFFTLSGYLITSLIIGTRERTGGLGLKTFWLRRARRLLPAVVLVLGATLATTAAVIPEKLGEYAGQSLSALFYVNNWHTILSDTSYFSRFDGPSPLSHMWSLSIEEQFYIAWPLVLGLFYLVLRKRWLITLATVGLAVGSFYLLSTFAEAGMDNTRAYEGTDTRAGGLLLGAALAFVLPARARIVSHNTRCLLDVIGLAGLAGILYLSTSTDSLSQELYDWGLLALTVATLAVLIASVTPSTLVATVLGSAPMRWIGERSYGIYLWHMPILAFVPASVRGGSPVVTAVVVVFSTLVIASLSWRYVEDPIRRYGFRAALTTPRRREHTLRYALKETAVTLMPRRPDAVAEPETGTPEPTGPENQPAETPAPATEETSVADDPAPTVRPAVPAPLREESVDLAVHEPLVEQPVDVDLIPRGSATPSSADTRRFRVPTEVKVLSSAPSVLNLPPAESPADEQDEPDTGQTDTGQTGAGQTGAGQTGAGQTGAGQTGAGAPREETGTENDSAPAHDAGVGPADEEAQRRRSPASAVLVVVAVLALAVGAMVVVSKLNPDLPVVSALYDTDSGGSGIDDELVDDGPKPAQYGPTLPADQRRTKCRTVIHVGDSTSIGMNDPTMQPNVALRLEGRYKAVGAEQYIGDVVGGRSSMERVNGEPNATESIDAKLARGVRGCWVIAMGVNDTANVAVGGVGPLDMRIDNLLRPLRGQPVLWPTVITNRLMTDPAYSNDGMRDFNRALVRACKRYPNLRIYDWAREVNQDWFLDGVHYTPAGYIERARRFAVALATEFPESDLPPAGCVLTSTTAVERAK